MLVLQIVTDSAPGGLSGCLVPCQGTWPKFPRIGSSTPVVRSSGPGVCALQTVDVGPDRTGVAAATRASETDKAAEGVALAAGPPVLHDAVPCVDARAVRLRRRGGLKIKR